MTTEQGDKPKKTKSRNRIIDALLITVIIVSLAFAGWSIFKPEEQIALPQVENVEVDPSSVVTAEPAIEGANSGWEGDEGTNNSSEKSNQTATPEKIAEPEYSDENTEVTNPNPEYSGEEVEIPELGDVIKGIDGELTEGTSKRSSAGQPITREMSAVCPKMTNGSICIPSQKKVIYYHSVGTYRNKKGVLQMEVPSTYSAGWLNDTAPVGSGDGTTLFAAHVTFRGGRPGPFYNLYKYKPGQDIIVRDMHGQNFLYRIYKTQSVYKDELPDELFETTGEPKLAFVTCASRYISGDGFKDRNIVWAAPVPQ